MNQAYTGNNQTTETASSQSAAVAGLLPILCCCVHSSQRSLGQLHHRTVMRGLRRFGCKLLLHCPRRGDYRQVILPPPTPDACASVATEPLALQPGRARNVSEMKSPRPGLDNVA